MFQPNTANAVKSELKKIARPEKAKVMQRFFKTSKGEYGEGDVFIGVTVPEQRKIAKRYHNLSLAEVKDLLQSQVHEHRLTALIILVNMYEQIDSDRERQRLFDFYLQHSKHINNWDLVDTTAPNIVGNFLLNQNRKILYKLARSENLWERRIAVLATFAFIRENDFADILKLSKILLRDDHDLMHKAVGWMLREVGKRDQKELEKFLDIHTPQMPRTMLRYAIERLPEKKRKHYLNR